MGYKTHQVLIENSVYYPSGVVMQILEKLNQHYSSCIFSTVIKVRVDMGYKAHCKFLSKIPFNAIVMCVCDMQELSTHGVAKLASKC